MNVHPDRRSDSICTAGVARASAVAVAFAYVMCAATPANAQPPSAPGTPLPIQMRVCTVEPVKWNPCGIWTLRNGEYDALWQDIGVTASVTVTRFAADGVSMTRTDFGRHVGTYYYRGKISASGHSIEGGETFDVNGRPIGHFNATWTEVAASGTKDAALEVDRERLPAVLHFCAYNCFSLEQRGDHYEVTDPARPPGTPPGSRWTFLQFAPGRPVYIHRHEEPSPLNQNKGTEINYTGEFSPDGNSLINVLQDGALAPNVKFAWGAALDTLPGSNAERDARQASQQQTELARRQALLPSRAPLLELCAGGCTDSLHPDRCDAYPAGACQVLVWEHDGYDAMWPDLARERLKVEQWSEGTVKLSGADDPTSFDTAEHYEGSIAENGAAYGTATFVAQGHTFHGNVSARLEHVPFRVRALGVSPAAPAACPPAAAAPLTARDVFESVLSARRSGDLVTQTCWDRLGAQAGFADFYPAYAYDLLFGAGLPRPDYAGALRWAQKSADANNRRGLLIAAEIYRSGLGVSPAPEKAHQYEAKAYAILKDIKLQTVRTEDLPDRLFECEADWGLMADVGLDCYAVVAQYIRQATGPTQPVYGSGAGCGIYEGRKRYECEHPVSQSSFPSDGKLYEARERASAICRSYQGDTLSNGDAFDFKRCNSAAYAIY